MINESLGTDMFFALCHGASIGFIAGALKSLFNYP
jgi:hypothetical protein